MKKVLIGLLFYTSLIYAGTLANMTMLKNGEPTQFSQTATDNYFMFTMNKSGTILLSGSDKYNDDIYRINLYDTDLNLIKTWSYVSSGTTAKLDAGTYIIQPVDSRGGTFSIYSNNMSDSVYILQDDDGDGVINLIDKFPNDIAASKDMDGDGKPDKWNSGKTEADSTTGLVLDTMVNEDAGNLIIVTGDSDDKTDPLYMASQKLSATYYNRFKQRGLSDDDIYWLNFNDSVDINYDGVDDSVVDNTYFSKDDFYNTITSWAVNSGKKGPLYIYMVDHGANGSFEISSNDINGDGEKEIVYANELKNSIETFIKATNRDVVLIIEACKSGSFIPYFKESVYKDKILLITSTKANQLSYIGKFGSVSFTKFLVDEILSGKNLYNSYSNAIKRLHNLGGVYAKQVPAIYAKSDSLKNIMVGGDFSVANMNLTSINNIYIDGVENNTNVDLRNKKYINLKVKLSTTSKINRVWATVITPDFTVNDGNFTTPDLTNYTQTLELNGTNEYVGSFYPPSPVMYSGEYDITFYVEDVNGLVYTRSQSVNVEGQEKYNPNKKTTKIVALNTGWNLISLPVDINISYDKLNSTFPTAYSIWKYKNNKWQLYIKKYIATPFDKITSIQKAQGFWINSTSDANLTFSGISYDTNITTFRNGWYLLGAGNDVNVSSLVTQNTYIQIIWTYEDGWKAYSPNSAIMSLIVASDITPLKSIKQGQGFWLNVK